MKLAYISQGYSPHDLRFLRALTAHGAEVFFLSLPGGTRESRPVPDGVETHFLSAAAERPGFPGRAALRRLAAWRPDVMLAGPLHTGAVLASALRRVPLVAMSHGFDLLYVLPASGAARRRIAHALQRADGFFADCPALLAAGKRLRDFPDDATVCLPWGIEGGADEAGLARGAALRRSLGWDSATVLVSLRNWEPVYAVPELLAAFAESAAQHDGLRLILGGSGSQRAAVRQLIRELNLTDKVHCPGSVPESEVWTLLGAADGYVSSARSDGSSISLLQAMAAGLPALVQDTGGNRDWISEGVHGWFFAVDAAATFARAVDRFVEACPRWQEIAQASRSRVASEANWGENQKRLIAFLETIARRNAVQPA